MATPKEILAHLFTNILDIDSDDIAAFKSKGGIWNYKKLLGISYDDLEKLYKSDYITLAGWRYVSDWKMYADSVDPTPEAIMAMHSDSWDLVDVIFLRLNHELAKITTVNNKPAVTADTVTTTQIEAVNFLKYVNVSLLDKGQILNFYDNIVTQATGYNIFLRPSDEITPTEGVVPYGMSPECEKMTATALYSKFCQKDTIATTYTDAHNMLATTTNGFEFLQLLIQQVHPLLAIKNIATVDIPKYSSFNNLFRYAREIKTYIDNHSLKSRIFSDKEITNIFLSHLDDRHYSSAIKQCEMAILHASHINPMYLVPAIASTIDQLAPSPPNTDTTIIRHQRSHDDRSRLRQDDRIRQLTDYCEDDDIGPSCFSEYISIQEEPPWIRAFQRGGGRSHFNRSGRGRGRYSRDQFGGRDNRALQNKPFKGKCNCCGMANHHADSCHFLLKLKQALSYLKMVPEAPHQKRTNFKGKNSYRANNDYVRSLQDAGFIPYDRADADNFLDVVDDDHDVFTPDIINSVDDGHVHEN